MRQKVRQSRSVFQKIDFILMLFHKLSPSLIMCAGQMHLWNPDEPSTPRGSIVPLSSHLEERLHEACEELGISWDRCAGHTDLLALCEHLGLEVSWRPSAGTVSFRATLKILLSALEFPQNYISNFPQFPSVTTFKSPWGDQLIQITHTPVYTVLRKYLVSLLFSR